MEPNKINLQSFFFPYSTCEKPHHNSIIQQPVSAFINLVTCIILIYFILKAKTYTIKFLIFSFLSFEIFHTFSHTQHIPGNIQAHIIHILWYILSIALIYSIHVLSKTHISLIQIFLLFIIIFIDVYLWLTTKNDVFMIFRGISIIMYIVLSHYDLLPKIFRNMLPYMIFGMIVLCILIYNENINCANMINFVDLPYHAVIEILGLILFTSLTHIFIRWENNIYK